MHSAVALRDRADQIQRRLASLGLELKPGCRHQIHLRRLRTMLAGWDEKTTVFEDLHVLRRLQQSIYEVHLLERIVERLGHRPEWRPRIQAMLGGNELPWRDKNDQSRNTEFELYVAMMLTWAGVQVEPCEPPDLLATTQGWTIGFAVKRLKSPKKLMERVREGRDQIARCGRPGYVAIDASILAMKRDHWVYSEGPEVTVPTLEAAFSAASRAVEREFRPARAAGLQLGVLFVGFMPMIYPRSGPKHFCVAGLRHWLHFADQSCVPPLRRLTQQLAGVPIF